MQVMNPAAAHPLRTAMLILWAACALPVRAEILALPAPGDDLVGEIRTVAAFDDDTLVDIARRNGLGYDEIRAANPAVDAWMPRADTQVTIPGRHLLPRAPREGIVINVAEMRLYYFGKAKGGQPATVETFPVSIGRGDWSTPLVTTHVSRKVTDPVWHPPKSIREEHAADGDPLPEVVRAGPDNPLGKYALHMRLPSYLIHGTNKQYGIGMQVTHGCIRMYPEDIERLYQQVPVGTPVRIINQPYKAGWHQGALYLEVHPLLEGVPVNELSDRTPLIEALVEATRLRPDYPIDWHKAREVALEASGMPAQVGPVLPQAAIQSGNDTASQSGNDTANQTGKGAAKAGG
jgi:L,D-transpeptidase ErfK/SrfK